MKFTASLEKQFGILREQLYRERMNQVEIQLAEVRDGNSQEYLEPLQRLKLNMQAKHEVADKLKEYRLNNIDHNFDCEMQSAKQNLEVISYKTLSEEHVKNIQLTIYRLFAE